MGSERPRLDAVLLDAGGTIIRLDFEWMTDTLGELGRQVTAVSWPFARDVGYGGVEDRLTPAQGGPRHCAVPRPSVTPGTKPL